MIRVKHKFQSNKPDGADTSLMRPSNWNDDHNLTMNTNRLVGRSASGEGPAEEIATGVGLTLNGGQLSVQLDSQAILNFLGFTPASKGGDRFTGLLEAAANFAVLGSVPTIDLVDINGSPSARILVDNGTLLILAADNGQYTTRLQINLNGDKTIFFDGLPVWTGLTIPVVSGGTGGRSASEARNNFGLKELATATFDDLVYSGTSDTNTNFPIGTTIVVGISSSAKPSRNATLSGVYLSADDAYYTTTPTSRRLQGTWRSRCMIQSGLCLAEKVAN